MRELEVMESNWVPRSIVLEEQWRMEGDIREMEYFNESWSTKKDGN